MTCEGLQELMKGTCNGFLASQNILISPEWLSHACGEGGSLSCSHGEAGLHFPHVSGTFWGCENWPLNPNCPFLGSVIKSRPRGGKWAEEERMIGVEGVHLGWH